MRSWQRTFAAAVAALLFGLGVAAAVTTASARPRTAAKTTAAKKQAKTRATARLRASSGRGTGHVPKGLLGPRWAKIGSGSPSTPITVATPESPTWTVPPATATTEVTTPEYKALGVTARDGALPWRISASLTTMPSGSYAVQLQNFGEDPHDLKVQRKADSTIVASFPQTAPMSAGRPGLAAQQVDLGRAGTYVLFCSLPGHWDSGMHMEIEVTG